MNMNDKPFADWSWKNQQSAAPRSNVLAPLGSGSMEQAAPNMNAAPAPVQPDPIESYAMSKGIGAAEGVAEGAIKGMSAAPLAAGTTAGAIAPGMSQSAMLASQTAGMGATGLTGATGAGLGTAGINAAAGGAAGAGAGASAAMAAMGPLGWAALGYMGGKSMGLFNDGTTDVPKGYMGGTTQVQGYQNGTGNAITNTMTNVVARALFPQGATGKQASEAAPVLKPEDYLSARNLGQGIDAMGNAYITNNTQGFTTTLEDEIINPSKSKS